MMNSNALRASLTKIMPGYLWTIHKPGKGATRLVATGIKSSGFNRLSTLQVTVSSKSGVDWYTARSAGNGRRAVWLHENGDTTLARALRGLQSHYRSMSALYGGHERALETGRTPTPNDPAPSSAREMPSLLSEDERKSILSDAEALWRDLQSNNLGGFSDGNRPFYILHEFKRVIEKYGNRDVGLTWSNDDLDAVLSQKEEGNG